MGPLLALALIAVGAFLVDSSVRNRHPGAYLRAVAAEPERAMELASAMAGTWVVIPGRDSGAGKAGGSVKRPARQGESGHLKDHELTRLSWAPNHRLAPAAAAALEELNKAFKARFGRNLTITSSYRSYAQQVATKAAKGKFAATPGKSIHGWGEAVDLGGGIEKWDSVERNWMVANAPKYGWISPEWAQKGKSTPEPWHWEYNG